MSEIIVLEVVSGLGVGGAEKALLSRLRKAPNNFRTTLLNTRPELDMLSLTDDISMIYGHTKLAVFIPGVRKILNGIKPDLVIVRTPLDAIRFSLIKMLNPKQSWRLLFEVHSNFVTTRKIYSPALELTLGILRSRIDYFIAVSKNVQSGPLCKSSKNSSVIYLGGDSLSNSRNFNSVSHPRLLFLGRLTKVKRPLLLVEAISRLAENVPLEQGFLTIVGDGDLRQDLVEMVQGNGLSKMIQVLGYQEDVSSYLSECTHLVSVSTNEGLPISFFEAKLAGMRIVSTPSGGGNEIFDEFDYELPSFGVEDLIIHLKAILNVEIKSDSREKIAMNSTWMQAEHCSKKYYDFLENLLLGR